MERKFSWDRPAQYTGWRQAFEASGDALDREIKEDRAVHHEPVLEPAWACRAEFAVLYHQVAAAEHVDGSDLAVEGGCDLVEDVGVGEVNA